MSGQAALARPQGQNADMPRATVFISYSHADRKWLERLKTHLKPLQREGLVDYWVDTRIAAGTPWQTEIEQALEVVSVAVLLVSADFLASDFIADDELPPLLTAAEERGARIIPLILSPSRFTRMPSLSRFKPINPPEQPLIKLKKWEQEDVLDRTTVAILEALSQDPMRLDRRGKETAPRPAGQESAPTKPARQLGSVSSRLRHESAPTKPAPQLGSISARLRQTQRSVLHNEPSMRLAFRPRSHAHRVTAEPPTPDCLVVTNQGSERAHDVRVALTPPPLGPLVATGPMDVAAGRTGVFELVGLDIVPPTTTTLKVKLTWRDGRGLHTLDANVPIER